MQTACRAICDTDDFELVLVVDPNKHLDVSRHQATEKVAHKNTFAGQAKVLGVVLLGHGSTEEHFGNMCVDGNSKENVQRKCHP
jgi:hypothetical protein